MSSAIYKIISRQFFTLIAVAVFLLNTLPAESSQFELVNRQAIDRVWAGNFANFDFLTEGRHQYVAYYDANRQMSVAHRKGPRSTWVYYKVDSWLGWDSHNYITMALDADGHLHLSGNLHADRIEYFRTRYPHEVRSLERIEVMADSELEQKVTYPHFLKSNDGDLIFKYRIGGSGDGSDIYLGYNTESRTWSNLHNGALIDGQGKMNAYVEGPEPGPDGRFHMVWIWRDSGDASTNHDISYARSPDLLKWEDSSGNPIQLPITFERSDVVDPVPPGGGAINNNVKLVFDPLNRPVVAYHKFDPRGNTQIYVSRREESGWAPYQVSDWEDFRWDFGGFGALPNVKIRLGKPVLLADGNIRLPVQKSGTRLYFIIDGSSLELLETQAAPLPFPALLTAAISSEDVAKDPRNVTGNQLAFRTLATGGFHNSPNDIFYITWEAQEPFRDQARDSIVPPSTLFLHQLQK